MKLLLPAVEPGNGWTWRIATWKGRLGKSSAQFWILGYTERYFPAITDKVMCKGGLGKHASEQKNGHLE